MIYGYARVSTNGQARDGNSLEAQEQRLKDYGAEYIFKDSFTGTKKHRPELDKLLNQITDGDTLIVTKLDRFARSVSQGCELINDLLDRGVTVNILNLGIIDNSATNKFLRTILFAFAELERDLIAERTSEGKAVAKLRSDYHEGRPKKELPDFQKFLKKQKDGEITVSDACRQLGISRTQWYRLVN